MKIYRLIPILIILVSFFTGCLEYQQSTRINKDGSGNMIIKFWKKLPDSTMVEKVSPNDTIMFNIDSIRSFYSSPYTKIEDISVKKDTTDSLIIATVKLSFSSVDSLNKTHAFENYKFSYVDGAPKQKVFSQEIPASTVLGLGLYDSTSTITFKYVFSGEIITDNATNRRQDTLIWKYKLSELSSLKTISVTIRPFKLDRTPIWIYWLAGGVLLIVFVFLIKKKKG
ncbi:MAG: hypothetical protein Q8903_10345 [Bacteroidota bacterium]|nr:hypothetical protein [Bacteroidota bacterium]